MTNANIIVIDIVLLAVTATLLLLAIARNRKHNGAGVFFVLCSLALVWELCDIFLHYPGLRAHVFLCANLKIAATAHVTVFILIFVLHYYRLDARIRVVPALLCAVPAITTVLVFTNPYHGLFYRYDQVIRFTPSVRIIREPGVWYWVNAFYGYLAFFAAILLLIYQTGRLPKVYRGTAVLMLGGTGAATLCNVLGLTLWNGAGVDTNIPGTVVLLIFLYAGMVGGGKNNILVLAHNEIFHNMEDRIFILNGQRRVVDANRAARSWLRELAITEETPLLDEVISHLTAANFLPIQTAEPADPQVYITYSPQLSVYQMREHTVTGRSGDILGIIVTFTDVTRYRMLIDRLEQTMGIDPLTGLGNRNRYQAARETLDRPEHLPLALLIGDVNGLKAINDTVGHLAGDQLLQICARAMEDTCKDKGQVFRIGGDEFICLMPQVGRMEAQEMLRKVRQALEESDRPDLLAKPSMSLGVDVKERDSQRYEDIFHNADLSMYTQKENDRRKGPTDRRSGLADRRHR